MALNSLCDRRPSLSLSSSVKRFDQVASFASSREIWPSPFLSIALKPPREVAPASAFGVLGLRSAALVPLVTGALVVPAGAVTVPDGAVVLPPAAAPLAGRSLVVSADLGVPVVAGGAAGLLSFGSVVIFPDVWARMILSASADACAASGVAKA